MKVACHCWILCGQKLKASSPLASCKTLKSSRPQAFGRARRVVLSDSDKDSRIPGASLIGVSLHRLQTQGYLLDYHRKGEVTEMTSCRACRAGFSNRREHLLHLEKSPYHPYYCRGCEKDFSSPEGLNDHYHKSRKHYYCRDCDKHYDDDSQLEEHYIDCHFYCGFCREVCASPFLHVIPSPTRMLMEDICSCSAQNWRREIIIVRIIGIAKRATRLFGTKMTVKFTRGGSIIVGCAIWFVKFLTMFITPYI